jgi:hypothetical protein
MMEYNMIDELNKYIVRKNVMNLWDKRLSDMARIKIKKMSLDEAKKVE